MGIIPTYDEAYAILKQYNTEDFHLKHARIVAGVLRYFAGELDPGREDFWEVVGLLHDLDFEISPEQHCIRSQDLMRELGLDESLIRATASHGYGLTVDIQPEHIMEKILFATDELTGLIGAVAIMRPSRSVSDLETKSVMKKFKTPAFAAGCSREVISRGADMLGWSVEDLIGRTILAMRTLMEKEGI
ncbi:MAG TPA: hydrolase [Clostridiales bacterium]|nr:hydrolase [Clostridiales bacterium]